MYERVLKFLRCPECGQELQVENLGDVGELGEGAAAGAASAGGETVDEIVDGLLHCPDSHWYPVVGGIPRMLPDSLSEHWSALEGRVRSSSSHSLQVLAKDMDAKDWGAGREYDRRTRANFSSEWDKYEVGDVTWGMTLSDRVQWFFLDALRIPDEELDGKVVLDAGCGNGSQSVAYTEFGLEVIAVDVSSGLEHGYDYRRRHPGARADRVHFVQGDLQAPPLAPASVDIIHSAGVLHHTPDTERTFRRLVPLLKPGGTFYVWLYKHERGVTPVVDALRAVTTRLTPHTMDRVARASAPAFAALCRTTNRLGLRAYPEMSNRQAALALLDIFGAPYAHAHTFPEAEGWFRHEGFDEVWSCNDSRRGFGVCGRLAPRPATAAVTPPAPENE